MSQEVKLIAATLRDRAAYERVKPFLSDGDFSPVAQFWWKVIGEWYAADKNATHVDCDSIAARAASRGSSKQRDAVSGFLADVRGHDVSASNVANIALELKRYNVGMELAAAIAAGDEKKQAVLSRQFVELREATELKGKKAVSYELAPAARELKQFTGREARIPLAPSRLNTRIDGGALPGTHILLFARPDMGKSTFSINFAAMLAVHQKKRVLYITNEDDAKKLKDRAVCRIAGVDVADAEQQWSSICDVFEQRCGDDRLLFLKLEHATPNDLRKPIEEYEPDILVIDQIRNLRGNGEMTQRLDENGQLVRELLNEYSLVGLSIAQAGASAEGRPWLGMEDLDNSKTGLPACADLMIGMGADVGMVARGQRALSIIKNKLSSAANAKEGLQVELDTGRVSVK